MAKFFKRLRENPFGFEFHRPLCQIKFGYTSGGMDAARCPSLRCILKQCLKLAQDAVYGQQKTFADFGSFQSLDLPAQRHLNF